jgi:glutamine---fructose-6-phosphate transaminase (isomerizing)
MVIMSDPQKFASPADSPLPYAHWMLREIHEQPDTLTATLHRYVADGSLRPDVCTPIRDWLRDAGREIVIAASGSSRHAGMAAELMIEDFSGIAVDVEYASEYCYRAEKALKNASVMVISQSGETADTLAALRKANLAGHRTLAITNVHGSTMAREATVSFPTLAGRERAVPATKSFTAQLLNLYLLSLLAAELRQEFDADELAVRLAELAKLPELIRAQLPAWETSVRLIAEKYSSAESFLFLGRGVHYPIAREGALKLKESAYLHAEGYPSGELKHGPNALVGDRTPLVMIATVDSTDPGSVERYEKVVQLMRDMRAQGATILAIANTGDSLVASLANDTVFVDEAREELLPLFEVVPLQLFSYFAAINNGIDVDRPRNLTKAVLAE